MVVAFYLRISMTIENKFIKEHMKIISPSISHLKGGNFSTLEKILMKYKLNEVANQLKKKRLFEMSIADELCS